MGGEGGEGGGKEEEFRRKESIMAGNFSIT